MTWTKLGAEFLDLAEDLSPDAAWTHVQALLYSNRRGLDLVIPVSKLAKLPHPPAPDTLEELFAAGVWHRRTASVYIGGYRPEWQLPADVVEHRRRLAATRQDRKRRHDAGDHSCCTDRCSVTRDVTRDQSRDVTPVTTRDPARLGSARLGQEPEHSTKENDQYDGPSEELLNGTRWRISGARI